MRIATFNVENLFRRPKAMNLDTWREGQPYLDVAAKLNRLFNKDRYTASDKRAMLRLLADEGLLATRAQHPYLKLNVVRGKLFRVPRNGPAELVANGRDDWVGWISLVEESIDDEAILNTARVISDVNPDVLVLVEVEDRIALQRFYDQVVRPLQERQGQKPYPYNMVIDGNDTRGIDVGILSRRPITRMLSHITELDESGHPVFSRDCPEYHLDLGRGRNLVVLPNHFASKGSDPYGVRRRAQAKAVRGIYRKLRRDHPHVLVAGDLNDYPAGGSLEALLGETDLVDAMALPEYDGLPGTYEHANASQKFDYLLMSPALRKGVQNVGVFRKGFYAPRKWESYENINGETKERFQASDHHCVWVDLGV